jgi:hypothetical protein
MRRSWPMVLIALLSQTALAQDSNGAEVERIVVTASSRGGNIPAVALTKQADFLVKAAELTNDTRDATNRASELHQTIKDLLDATKSADGLALGYGEDFLIPITDNNYNKVPLTDDDRKDTSSVTIYVKAALPQAPDVEGLVAKIAAFVEGAKVTGRTLIKPEEDVYLSLVEPEKYRQEIIKKIVDDMTQLRATLGTNCKIKITGLENRVTWERTDVSELTLYIPYEAEVTDCS